MKKGLLLPCVFFAAASADVVVWADEPEPDPVGAAGFGDEVEVNLVNIDVFVCDKRGNAVTGLEVGDCVVRQDGEEREITNFAALTEEVYRTTFEELVMPAVPIPASDDEEDPVEDLQSGTGQSGTRFDLMTL